MAAPQSIVKVRRRYNKWVADQTLEDYALRFTARAGRKMSIERVAQTALGATAFLALEGIAAAVTLSYGFTNTLTAMLVVALVFFVTGLPISYYCARYGLDIDLLTRGAGFGYLGSTLTSMIYASFTFIFFAIEAAILASALQLLFGIPLSVGYLLCALAVIPVVSHGISAISRFQVGTQALWLVLQCTALAVVIGYEYDQLEGWLAYVPPGLAGGGQFDIVLFGAAASVFFALVPQIGEQVDYLRFMPQRTEANQHRWWFWLVLAGPGWILVGLIKMLLGSFVAWLAISQGASFSDATDPTRIYQQIFTYLTHSPSSALVLAGLMVIISQLKINVTNAYAGSIAWSNVFCRLTHSHPGRVVWLLFNVAIALILMELGIYQALEAILGMFAILAVSWLASLAADLLINKPLGLSPAGIEFKRAHLYDINPVGAGSMLLATLLGLCCYLGWFGEVARSLCHFVSLVSCFISVPLIGWLTGGRYYLARPARADQLIPHGQPAAQSLTCEICENSFELEDMSYCPAYGQPICSLCCSLDVRCMDHCKPHGRFSAQLVGFLRLFMPRRIVRRVNSRLGRFIGLLLALNLLQGALLVLVYRQMQPVNPAGIALLSQTLWMLFFILLIASGVLAWFFLLAHESRVVAQKESNRQTRKLLREIDAHDETDRALQQAKELAERANAAKSRYISGISHELRTPLQSILGYAQLLAERPDTPAPLQPGLNIIHRSGQYLAGLIEGLLDISKIEAGRLELYRNRVALPELISQLAQMFAIQAADKGIEFDCHISNTLPQQVIADEKRLRQILINLLSNAVKYTASGRVEFRVRYRNQVAEFRISDTGPGIAEEQRARIFEPFERVRNADSPNLPGTGLGLTIVKLLTEIMGGDLQLTTEPGQGSCFAVSLMLPWVSPGRVEGGGQEGAGEPQRIVGYEGYQRSLCVVDDDPVLRGLLADLLLPLGFQVLEAHDGPSCLALLDSSQPALFLLDISMPGMNGLELAAALRQRGVQAPLVMLSADAREYHGQHEAEPVFDDYLVKPVGNQALLDTLATHLNLSWIWQDATPCAETDSATPPLPTTPHALAIPDHPLIHELQGCAEIGYRKGVVQALAQLAEQELLAADTFAYLEQLSNALQFARLAETLEQTQR